MFDDRFAGVIRFRDEPRTEGLSFVKHLGPKHRFDRILLVSGDRESEVRYLADRVGIRDVYFSQSPEQKLDLVRQETKRANTLFLGDGINDSPALTAATVGLAFGSKNDVTAEAAGGVILDTSLEKVDEFFHIGRRIARLRCKRHWRDGPEHHRHVVRCGGGSSTRRRGDHSGGDRRGGRPQRAPSDLEPTFVDRLFGLDLTPS